MTSSYGPLILLLMLISRIYAFRGVKPHARLAVFIRSVAAENDSPKNFITNIIEADITAGRNGGRVRTRFPPEPNGYLHLGHAKSICLNFGVAAKYSGKTNMRFDDTNPAKEDIEYVNAILEDVRWLAGGDVDVNAPWDGEVRHASDYFQVTLDAAIYLIKQGKAYVDDLTAEQVKEYRGTLTEPGRNSPFRDRGIEENLALFQKMQNGEFPDGKCLLRAKIDMSSPNINMRDPALYRIKRARHPMTGDKWLIYPMYDFAHAISDALEEITHSLCTLEFADHRPLYDWTIDSLRGSGLLPNEDKGWRPVQTEFSRLNLQYTVLSKRKLIQLVMEGHVQGWDDPRMPTLCGIRRRGYPASALKLFCERVGISKAENNIDISVLEDCAREILDEEAPRALAVLEPLKVTITNWPKEKVETFTSELHPKKSELGSRDIPFSGSVCIDREDFFDTGPNGDIPVPTGYKRLLLGGTVRLKYAYVIKCDKIVRDPVSGKVVELLCSYDERTKGGVTPEGSKRAKGIIQWVSEPTAVKAEVRLYDRLFSVPSPGKEHEDGNFLRDLNPESIKIITDALIEPSLVRLKPGEVLQFERLGYFVVDRVDNKAGDAANGIPVKFNRVVTLKDTWTNAQPDESFSEKPKVKTVQKENQASSVSSGTAVLGTVGQQRDILRVDLRVGRIVSAEKHPDADSLLVEKIDCGDSTGPRTIISGLAKYYKPEELVGKLVVVVCNLKSAKMRGILSEGMVLCGSSDESVELLTPPDGSIAGELLLIEGLDMPKPDEVLKSKPAQEMLKREFELLKTNSNREGTYEGKRLLTSKGACIVSTLINARIQ